VVARVALPTVANVGDLYWPQLSLLGRFQSRPLALVTVSDTHYAYTSVVLPLIPLIPLAWVLTQLELLPTRALHLPVSILRSVDSLLLIIIAVAFVEATSAFVFDYLFAVRRRVPVPQIVQSLVRSIVYILLFLFV